MDYRQLHTSGKGEDPGLELLKAYTERVMSKTPDKQKGPGGQSPGTGLGWREVSGFWVANLC